MAWHGMQILDVQLQLQPSSKFQPNKMLSQVVALLLISFALASADLHNSDFESPPSNLPVKSTSPFVALSNKTNTIPGWTFQGNVTYVTAADGHALQLLQNGKINQTFIAGDELTDYLLTFALSPGGKNCSANAGLVLSASDTTGVYYFKDKYGKESWQSYGHYLGMWGEGESVNLVIQSQTPDSNSSSFCWPVIDKLLLTSVPKIDQTDGNALLNEGFEFGPPFPSNSTQGLLLDSANSPIQSPLMDWSVIGTLRYIDSDHFSVPQGKAAVELVSGVSAGVQTAVQLVAGSDYILEFKLGDANNNCVEHFIVGAQAGSKGLNFTLPSNGTGSATNFFMNFTADSSTTTVGFISYTTSHTKDGTLCGPVIDDVVLKAASGSSSTPGGTRKSGGMKTEMHLKFLVSLILLAILW